VYPLSTIDTPLVYRYKHAMKHLPAFLAILVTMPLAACSALPLPFRPVPEPTASPTPDLSASATDTLTPTFAPTPTPLTRIQSGERALFLGDFDVARQEFTSAYRDGSSAQVQAAALWGMGRTEYTDGRFEAAVTALQQLLDEFPDSAFIPYAHFLLGESFFALGRFQESSESYDLYLQLRPGVLDGFVLELRGDALFENKDFAQALTVFEAARNAQVGDTFNLEIKLAQTRIEIGDYASAISVYESIFTRSDNDYVKAQIDYLSGMANLKIDQNELAYAKFQHAVENYPLSYYAYLSLVELVNANIPVSELDRGLVDYFAGQYTPGLAALDRYIESGLDGDGTARYYRALTLIGLKEYARAVEGLSYFITNYPDHPRWTDAWEEKASTLWFNLGDYPTAAQTYVDFVAAAPASPAAADFLMSAARVLERDSYLEEAAFVWERVANEYPDSLQSSQALFLSGLAHYRRGDFFQALPVFQRSLLLSSLPEDQARAYLWIGKTQQQLGDQPATLSAWQQAQALDPTGYYSERAKDLMLGRKPFEPPPSYNLEFDLETERAAAAAWVRLTFDLPTGTDLEGLGSLAGDARIVRGTEYWELGLYDQARVEFEDVRLEISSNPEDNFRFANYMLDLGLYRPAIFAARQVLTLAGLDDQVTSLSAPVYFNHIRYGTYYADLITSEAEKSSLHPLFLFSVVRQESLFEGFVRSTAGARGLMQIIPSTGASIASSLGWPPAYDAEDLYRPNVSLRLGSHYLASNRNILGGDLYAALAAYNAGPGNAAVWKELAGDDPDLLLEVIRFQETRDYIRFIYEIHTIYRKLYSPME
jgi:soluble lytic murein transglycosylase